MVIVEIQFEPNVPGAMFLAPDILAGPGARFIVPGVKAGDPERMGTVVSVRGKPEHDERLPEVIRPLAPGETWNG